jgi:hypothetical protein
VTVLADEVTQSCPTWARAAESIDRYELALTLLDATPDADDDVTRAALLLQTGQPARALALLAAQGYGDLPDVAQAVWPDLVLGACRAAAGDTEAYRGLRACARRFDGAADGWRLCYLIAAAAAGVSDRATADQAWHALVTRYEIITPVTVAEFCAAQVAARDPYDAIAATTTLAGVVADLHVTAALERNPAPALRTASALRLRGDDAGARLLLHGVRRRIRSNAELDAALADLTPAAPMRRHRMLVVVLWCLAPLLFPLGIVGGLLVLASRLAWQRWIPIPGLNRTDSVVWRAFQSLSYDPHTDPAEPPAKDQTGYYGAAALLSLLFVALPLGGPTAALVGFGRAGEVGTWLLLCLGIPALAFLGARQAHREMRARRHRRRREAEQRSRLSQARRCHCWQVPSTSGPFAVEYYQHHLHHEPLPMPSPVAASLGRCPTTGALWLAVDADDPARAVLLRGTPHAETEPAPGMYL